MLKSKLRFEAVDTKLEKYWPYQQYYVGERDLFKRKNGFGENTWSGAKSMENYIGLFTKDTMHGEGDYLWRHYGYDHDSNSYEGHFYANHIHGYGTMSYGDGRVFNGTFFHDFRWGPGVQTHSNGCEDIGLWRGTQLIRLSWKPKSPSVVPDFMTVNNGRICVESHRIVLNKIVKTISEANMGIELLKDCGADPQVAVDNCQKVYPKNCTDLSSPLCCNIVFDQAYYDGKINLLEHTPREKQNNKNEEVDENHEDNKLYYAWNNNEVIIHMMKHCYMHDSQRARSRLDLAAILSNKRHQFKPAGKHEIDCRILLMSSYLGHIEVVAQLINECNVHPDVTDVLGNNAVMYAVAGNQPEVIKFLEEAGANVDYSNDSCCTPLGVALMMFTCLQKDISPHEILQAVLPLTVTETLRDSIRDWNINRNMDSTPIGPGYILGKSSSKATRTMSSKKIKSMISLKDQSVQKKKTETISKDQDNESDESIAGDKSLYTDIAREYYIKLNDHLFFLCGNSPVSYIFEVYDIMKDIEAFEDEQNKVIDKNVNPKKVISKSFKDTTRPSKDALWHGNEKEEQVSTSSAEKKKTEMLQKLQLTILQLLSNGANPQLIICPVPALVMAINANWTDLIRHLVNHGTNVNEFYPHMFGYSPLDIVISHRLTYDNLDKVRALLGCGADTQHRLPCTGDSTTDSEAKFLGPNLLHAVLLKKPENESEEEIQGQLLELLLEHNCDPILQFMGRSAIDIAMSKNVDIFGIFIEHRKTKLNSVINNLNQSILVKMFYLPFFKSVNPTERLHMLTNLLLFGCDPFLKCRNGDDNYHNIFTFAHKTLLEMGGTQTKVSSPPGSKIDAKDKNILKSKKDEKIAVKSMGKVPADDIGDYTQTLELITDCARLIYTRWVQVKLARELLKIISKYKYRHWNMIIKEHKNKKTTGLWITAQRALEIWDILTTSNGLIYNDTRDMKHFISIVHYYNQYMRNIGQKLTADVKNKIDSDVSLLLKEHKAFSSSKLTSKILATRKSYAKVELVHKNPDNFNVCFECMLPLAHNKILCKSCRVVTFCSHTCIDLNKSRVNCHPCDHLNEDEESLESIALHTLPTTI